MCVRLCERDNLRDVFEPHVDEKGWCILFLNPHLPSPHQAPTGLQFADRSVSSIARATETRRPIRADDRSLVRLCASLLHRERTL